MNITKRTRLAIGAVGVCAAVGLGAGGAFTGGGLTTNAGADQFVGGTISQTVSGAVLSSIAYNHVGDPTNRTVTSVTLTFAAAVPTGKTVSMSVVGVATQAFTCTSSDDTIFQCTGTAVMDVTSVAVTVAS